MAKEEKQRVIKAFKVSDKDYMQILLNNFKNGLHREEWTMSNGIEAYRWVRNPLGAKLRIETVEDVDIQIYAR